MDHPTNTKVLHTEFALRKKSSQDSKIKKYGARLIVCGSEESENDSDLIFSVADYTSIKVPLCLAVQRESEAKPFDFQDTFLHGKLDRPVCDELPQHTFFKAKRKSIITMLQQNLFGPKDALKI